MGTGDDRKSPAGRLRHGGFWRAEREWPLCADPADALLPPRRRHASIDGPPAEDVEPDHLHVRPAPPGPDDRRQHLVEPGPDDQRRLRSAPRDDTHAAENRLPLSERRDVLVFRTEPLAEDLEVTGPVAVRLWVCSTAVDTDFTAKLIDEIPPEPGLPARAST